MHMGTNIENSMLRKRDSLNIEPEELYSMREAAEFLDVTPETVKMYCRNGKLKGQKVGPKREWKVRGSEINRLRDEWNLD